MNQKFDKDRYLLLISERKEKRYLPDSNELLYYHNLIDNDVTWKKRFQYLELLESFCSGKIDSDEYSEKVFDLRYLNMDIVDTRLKNIQYETNFELPHESGGFANVVDILFDYIESWELEGDDLKTYIEEYELPRVKEYCEKFKF